MNKRKEEREDRITFISKCYLKNVSIHNLNLSSQLFLLNNITYILG